MKPLATTALLLTSLALSASSAQVGIDDLVDGRAFTHPILSPEFQAGTDRATGSPLTAGNAFTLLETGAVSFPRKIELIRSAQRSILFTTMIAMEDSTGRQLRRELVAAAERGVDVHCILDGNLIDPRFTLRLRLGGVKVVRFNKVFSRDRKKRLHIKTLVVDSRTAVLGGMNMTDDYNLGDGQNQFFKDTDLLVEGDAAVQAALHFQDLWNRIEEETPGPRVEAAPLQPVRGLTETLARFIVQESDLGQTTIRDYYTRCFHAAQERIIWHVNNLNPKGPLAAALAAAVKRGVRVICITNSVKATGGLYGEKVGEVWYRALSRNRDRLRRTGVELWELDVPVHSKALVVDGVMAAVGSYNVGSSKSDANLESTFVVYDRALVGEVEAMLERDLARSTLSAPSDE